MRYSILDFRKFVEYLYMNGQQVANLCNSTQLKIVIPTLLVENNCIAQDLFGTSRQYCVGTWNFAPEQ